jgi:hypothetical protein
MKKCFLNWNKDTVDDSIIFKHLSELSGGKLNLSVETETLSESKNLLRGKPAGKSSSGKKSQKGKNWRRR